MTIITRRCCCGVLMAAAMLLMTVLPTTTHGFSVKQQQTTTTTTSPVVNNIIQSYTLFEKKKVEDNEEKKVLLGRCIEVEPPPKDPMEEEDEVELWYATTRRSFLFPTKDDDYKQELSDISTTQTTLRLPSFGCGKHGSSIWPAGIALASLIAGFDRPKVKGQRRFLELGAGCGLPSVVAKKVIQNDFILSTDFWELEDDVDMDRLMPKNLFGTNLAYNLDDETEDDIVRRLDWHDTEATTKLAKEYQPNFVVGSDLVLYPVDMIPLLRTFDIMIQAGNAEECILICPLHAEREAMDDFRSTFMEIAAARREKDDVLANKDDDNLLFAGCELSIDKLEMIRKRSSDDDDVVYEFQRFSMKKKKKSNGNNSE